MQNPLSPDLSKTHDRVTVRRGYSYAVTREVEVPGHYYFRGRGRKRRRVHVRGYSYTVTVRTVRVPPVYKWVPKPARAAEGWEPVSDFQAELQEEYELKSPDLVYRFSPASDVIHRRSAFVWDAPLRADPEEGGFQFPDKILAFRGVRIWVLVRYEGGERNELWARTYKLPPNVTTWAELLEHRDRLFERIYKETASGQYELDKFAAWTAYVKILGKGGAIVRVKDPETGVLKEPWSTRPGAPGMERMTRGKPKSKRTTRKRK